MIKSTRKYPLIAISLMVMSFVSLTVQAQSSVWKVSKGSDHIFIGGTVHILPASEFPLPKEFAEAFNKSTSLVLEAKLPDPSDTMKMMQQMTYGNGQTIDDFISVQTQEKLNQYVSTLGTDMAMFKNFKPGFLVTILSLLEAKKSELLGEGVDIFYSNKAKKYKKPIAYLESVEFQMNMIATMGVGDEENFIKLNLEQMQDFKAIFLALLKAWRAGDEQQLNKLAIMPMKEDPKTLKRILTDRNQNWLPLIEAMFGDNDKEFVLVGVAHLAGDKSVLALLKAKGYRVEKI